MRYESKDAEHKGLPVYHNSNNSSPGPHGNLIEFDAKFLEISDRRGCDSNPCLQDLDAIRIHTR
jgi:hypothetical protein